MKNYFKNIYQYFFPPEPEVDYTDIPADVRKHIDGHYSGGLTNKEKQDAVNKFLCLATK
jgi:hypothetical protein